MISEGKIFGVVATIDFGNFTVGIATICVAMVSFFVAFWSKKHEERKTIAVLRETWVSDLRRAVSEYVAELSKIRTSARLNLATDENADFYIENIANTKKLRTYIELKLNKKDPLHNKINQYLEEIVNDSTAMWNARKAKKKSEEIEIIQARYSKNEDILMSACIFVFNSEWKRIKYELKGSWFREFRYRRRLIRAFTKFEEFETGLKAKKE